MNTLFDDLSRIIASPIPRRQALKLASGVVGGAVVQALGLERTSRMWAAALEGPQALPAASCGKNQFRCPSSGSPSTCCATGSNCCTDRGAYCCPTGAACCKGFCCPSGQTCCNGACCPSGHCCGTGSSATCCRTPGNCFSKGSVSRCCSPGTSGCQTSGTSAVCCSAGRVCCGSGVSNKCCRKGPSSSNPCYRAVC